MYLRRLSNTEQNYKIKKNGNLDIFQVKISEKIVHYGTSFFMNLSDETSLSISFPVSGELFIHKQMLRASWLHVPRNRMLNIFPYPSKPIFTKVVQKFKSTLFKRQH